LKWEIKNNISYKVTDCGKVFNIKTGRLLKRCYNSGSIGYWIAGKFYTLKTLRRMLVKIDKVDLPF
jgi:hypothetical protein